MATVALTFITGAVGKGKATHAVFELGECKGQTACGKAASATGERIDISQGDSFSCRSCWRAIPSWSGCLVEVAEEQHESVTFEAEMTKGTEVVGTHELAEGDLVLHYGMVIRLGAPKSFQGWAQRTVYHFPGEVQNMHEVYNRDHVTAGLLGSDASWAVQGNELATWTRVKRAMPAEADKPAEATERREGEPRELDIWLIKGVVLIAPASGDRAVFQGWKGGTALLRHEASGDLLTVPQSEVTTWRYVPHPADCNQVWRSKETGDLVCIVDTARDAVRLRGMQPEDRPFWLSRELLAEHFTWEPEAGK